MLTENDVVQAVAAFVEAEGYRVDKACSTLERGVDVIAVHPESGQRLLVEAKGATSSKPRTRRFGREFTPNQVKSHVSVEFYCAAKLRQQEHARVALAFPDNPRHREVVKDIRYALDKLGIEVFFVDESRRVVGAPDYLHGRLAACEDLPSTSRLAARGVRLEVVDARASSESHPHNVERRRPRSQL